MHRLCIYIYIYIYKIINKRIYIYIYKYIYIITMDVENVHSCHSDQSLSDLLQNAIETHTETPSNLCDILQRLLAFYPNSTEMSFNNDQTQNRYDLQRLEMEIEQSLNADLCILLQTMINRRGQQLWQNSVQKRRYISRFRQYHRAALQHYAFVSYLHR